MYVTSPNNMYKYSFNWRNDSGELDVFDASRYFSSAVEDQIPGNFDSAANLSQKVIICEARQHQVQRAARMSLDSIMRDEITPQDQAKDSYKSKKYKQPSSPGGKLSSFLNSLFNQTRSKKKRKSQPIGPKNLQEKEIPGERRSSISHFRTDANTKNVDSRSRNFCLSSGFMQSTPTKPGKELKFSDSFEHQKHKDGGNVKPNSLQNEFYSEKKCTDNAWIEKKLRLNKNSGMNWIDDQYTSEEKEFRKFSDGDDGGDTDSSSDLFELPNCDFEFYSKSLPVYQTTRVNSIRRGHTPV